MNFSSDETKRLQMVRNQLKEWGDNIPDCIKHIQRRRRELENELENNMINNRWDDTRTIYHGLSKVINHTCIICGYSFGDESCMYGGVYKDMVLDLVKQQKEAHVEVCRSGIFSW